MRNGVGAVLVVYMMYLISTSSMLTSKASQIVNFEKHQSHDYVSLAKELNQPPM